MVCSSLIDSLASDSKEGFCFISVASLNSVQYLAGSSANTGLLSQILCMALCISLYTQNRRFNIWQLIHPLEISVPAYFSMKPQKMQLFFRSNGYLPFG